jgi:hypothetical protein
MHVEEALFAASSDNRSVCGGLSSRLNLGREHMVWRSAFRKKLGHIVLMVFMVSSITACVSIPREAPELSAELGKRIAAIEASHLNLLHKFMDAKRAKVDEFLVREWVPVFAEEVFSEKIIRDAWTAVVTSGTDHDRLKFITILGPRIQEKINKKRLELIQPLDDLELTIERRLRDEYAQARAMNNTITSFLASAAEVAENRDRFLNMLGLDDRKISNALDETDKAVSELVTLKRDKVADFMAFKKKIDKVIGDIKR